MKFRLVDGVLQRTLVSPSTFQEVKEQPSMEQAPTQAATVPSVQQFETEFVHVPDEVPPIPSPVQVPSLVHTQDESKVVGQDDLPR